MGKIRTGQVQTYWGERDPERERPDGRQATVGSAFAKQNKTRSTCSTYKKEDRRLAIFFFACGAYEALVEFTVNALVHRSLSWMAPIRIFILDNRVEIHSPGELPNGLTVEKILKGTSMPRNKFLFTNANYLLPYTGAGTGITRAMKEKPDVTFENMEEAHEFVIVIHRNNNQEKHQVEHQVEHQEKVQKNNHKIELTKIQKDIVNFCSVPRTAKEIMDRIGVYNQSRSRKKHIQPLLEMGALEMTNPDNPKDRNQKYRKVIK